MEKPMMPADVSLNHSRRERLVSTVRREKGNGGMALYPLGEISFRYKRARNAKRHSMVEVEFGAIEQRPEYIRERLPGFFPGFGFVHEFDKLLRLFAPGFAGQRVQVEGLDAAVRFEELRFK